MRRRERVVQVPEGVGQLQEDGGDVPVQPEVRKFESAPERVGTSHAQDHRAGKCSRCSQVTGLG